MQTCGSSAERLKKQTFEVLVGHPITNKWFTLSRKRIEKTTLLVGGKITGQVWEITCKTVHSKQILHQTLGEPVWYVSFLSFIMNINLI